MVLVGVLVAVAGAGTAAQSAVALADGCLLLVKVLFGAQGCCWRRLFGDPKSATLGAGQEAVRCVQGTAIKMLVGALRRMPCSATIEFSTARCEAGRAGPTVSTPAAFACLAVPKASE